jgi:hypothetical protein
VEMRIRRMVSGSNCQCKRFTILDSIPESSDKAEAVFLNVYGAPESIPRNEFRQPM